MSSYSEELKRRLEANEPFEQIATWYVNNEEQANDLRHYDELPLYEQIFLDRLNESFTEAAAELHRTVEEEMCRRRDVNWDIDRFEAEHIPKALAVLRAEGARTMPLRLDLVQALCILAPCGDPDAVDLLAVTLDTYDPDGTLAGSMFAARRSIAVLFAALDAHPGYVKTKYWWVRTDDTAPELCLSAPAPWPRPLIAWFCETHPMQVLRIERDLKTSMRKQGWHV
jgi:hypothetical protein